MDENRKKLYDQLSATYDMGTFDEFDTDLDNEDNQKVAWEAMGGQDGYGDFSMFQQAIQRSPQAAEAGTTGNTGATESADAATMAAVTPMMEAQQPDWTTTDSAMPGEDDADADISLPDAPNPNTPKDASAVSDGKTENKPDVVSDKEQSGNVALHTEDYSTKSVEELKSNIGVPADRNVTQHDIDSRVTYIESIVDPVQKQAEYDKLMQSLDGLNRYAQAERDAERVVQSIPAEAKVAQHAESVDPAWAKRDEAYGRLVRDGVDYEGKKAPSAAQRGIAKNPKRYNDNIMRVRQMSDDELRRGYATVMDSTAYRTDEQRAVDAVPYIIEMNARANGGHAQTMGEEVAKEYLAQHPELKEAYNHWKSGDEGYRSDIDKDPAAAIEVAPFAIADRVLSKIDRRINEINKNYTDEVTPDPRKPIPGGVLRDPSGAQLSAMQRRIYDLAEVGNLTRMIQDAFKSYDPVLLNSYIAAFAEKENTDIPSAKKAVADIVLQKVRAEILSRMTPENNAAYASYALFGNTFAANILKAGLALMTSKPGETTIFGLEDEALANYGATHQHWWDQVVRGAVAVGTLAIDAETIGFSGPSFLSGLAGRVVANRASNVFLNRLLTSTISGAVNFGTFEAQTEWVNQLKTGERNIGKIFTRFGGGLAKGAAFGTVNSAVDRLFWNARGWVVPFGEAVKILGETAVFSGIGYLETGKLTAEDLGTNFGMVMSGKVKDPVGYIRDVQARMEGKRYLPKINRISKEYAETLSQKGYSIISSILRTGRVGREQLIGLDGELNKMRSDNTVPWETLRMAEYALDGRLYPSPPATKVKIERGEDSAWTFTPTDNDGRAVGESITVKGTEAKKVLGAKFAHEIEKNNLLIKETASWDASVCRELGKAVLEYCKDNVDGDATSVYKIFMTAHAKHTAGVKLGDVEREIYFGVNARLKDVVPTDDVSVYKAESKRAGYDLDRIVRKPADERSEPERIALKNYIQWLDGREVDARDLNEYDFKEWAERAPEVAASNSARIAREYEQNAEELRGHIEELRGRLDMGNVVVLENIDQVEDAGVRRQIEQAERKGERGVPGWYDESTDTTYVYLPHAESIEDLDRTIMHEQVTHHGLRVLKTQGYNDLCDRVWNSMSDAERDRWENYPGVKGIDDQTKRQRAAADEYIANLAERTDPESAGLWSRFVAWAKEGMRSLGIRTDRISDAELEQIIRESYRNLREQRGEQRGEQAERGGEGEPRKEGPIIEGEPEHIHEDKPDDGAVPPDDGGTTPPEGVAAPPAADGGETPAGGEPPVERPTAAVGRVEGTPADLEDWRELMTLDPDELDSSQVTEGLSLLESEREQAHRYANGELADEPSNWEYWAARDGLSEPTRQAEPAATEPPVTETPNEPMVETEPQHTEPVATETPTEAAQRATKLPKGANAEAETMEPSELPMTEHITKMTDAWGDVTRVEVVGQNDNGTTRVRLWFKNRDQRGVEADVDLRGPQPPETPTPPTEPTGDAKTADTTTERPAEVTSSADDQQMNDVLGAKLGEVDEAAERRAAQEADPYYMPMENKGGGRMSPNYRKATAEQIFNHLNDRENASGRDTLDGNIADGVKRAEDKLKAVERREPKGKGRSDAALDKWEKELSEARAQLEKWREVERMRREQKAAEGDDSDPTWKQAYDVYTSSDEYPSSLEDYVARHLYGTKFKWKDKELERTGGRTHGLGGHLGLGKSEKERRGFFGWIDEKNGSYPESVAEGIHANMPDWMRDRYDTMEVLDAVLSVVGGNPRPRDMVVDYAKRLREQSRDMDEYYADEAAGARGFADAGEMDAYDNMREREATGFHDVAAAGREADGARADLLADARARLSDPNASEYEKQAARTVLRFRQRGGQSTIQGLDGYTEDEVLSIVREDIEEKLADAGVDGVRINGMAIHGSRKRGDARSDSDLDVVVEYDGDISEDGLFNLLNDVPLTIEGVEVDINPITEGKSGTLEQYMERSRSYDASKKADSDLRFRIRGEHSGHEAAVEDARRRLESDDASEFERQAARAVIKAYGGGSDDAPDTPGGGVRFRIRDDADMLVDMAKHNNEVARQRRDAVTDFVKAITDVDELTDSKFATALGKVMRGQRQYDQDTVADITTMVKAMMDAGLLTELDNFSVKQILTKVKDSTGKNDITAEANKLIDIMLKHQLKKGKSEFEKSLKVKGMKQDSRGVVVQGGLDYHGQRMVKALKEGLSLGDLDAVNQRIDEAEQRLSDPDEVVRGNAKDELDGLYVARQYFDQIKQNEITEAAVKQQLEQAKQDHKNGTMSDEAYKQFRQACEEALRSLRCERVDAWSRLNETIGDRQGESTERAKQFRDQQKQRKEEIQHWANSDMEGHSADPHENETKEKGFMGKVGDTLHSLEQWFMQPLGTFDMLMRYFGNAHPKGEGYLFGFVRRFMNQRDQWFKQRKADFDKMDQAAMTAAAHHGMKIKDWAGIYSFIKKLPKLTITVKGKDYAITQGNAVYLLAMENQADGRMKLRAMGLTEADMERLRGQVNPMLLELSDWVVKELLPGMRPRLNQTHIRMFGADMTDIPNYFPIRTSALARNDTVNLAQQGGKIRPATITGSVIERKRNNTDLDLSADFFQVTAEHIDEMEHWNSFAEYARDLNTLLSYNRFRAQVNNLHSWRYGDGKEIWKTLEDTAAITTGDYQPKTSTADTTVNTAIQGLAAANITFRPFTALKQLLSFPVYFVQARWDDMGYALANLKGTWQWAIDNLPTFAERWQGRMAGDPILTQAEQERGSQNRRLRWLGKAGFAANAAVDAMTVAIGARSIYRTKLRRYKEMGYSEEEANKRALEDAAISVNETQQSGLGAFTSVIQQDRTFFSRMVTLYRNASMGYQRQLAQGLKAMRNSMSKEWRDTARAKVQKKLERDGIDSATAAKVADRLVNRENLRGLALAAMFGSIAPFVWSLGAQYLGYKMAGGDDDEQENQMLAQAATHLLSGWAEGIVGGSTVSSAADFIYDYINGRKKLRDYSLQHDLLTDMSEKILGKSSSKPADAVYDIVNMLVAMGTGVNPKSIVEPVVGIIDVVENWGGDAALAHEVALGFCRVLNVPQTSLDKVYVDEIGLTAREAQNLTAEEFAERWCRYKRRRGAGYLSPLTSEESDKETEKKLLQRYERMMDERFESLSDERVEKIMSTTDDKLLKKHAAKAYKSRIDALTDDDVQSYLVPLSDSAPQDSVDVKREGIKRAYKSEGLSYDTPSDREKNAQAYERHATMTDIAEDAALKGRLDALKKSVGDEFEKMGAEYKKGSGGWGWYIPDAAKSRADEIHAYKKAHEAELDEYGILSWWFGSSKGSSGYIKKGFTDGKHDAGEVMKEYRAARKRVLAKTKQL